MTDSQLSPSQLSWGQKLRYGAEAAVFFAFMALFRVIGLDRASRLGGWIGRNIFPLLPPDRVARTNLALAFPEKTREERDEIRRSMWDNLGRVVGEYPHLGRFSPKGEDPRIGYTFPPGVTAESFKGLPLMFLSGHFANWEMMPILAHQLGFEAATVVRPPNNPYVAEWVAEKRRINGPTTMIAKHNAVRAMLAHLRGDRSLCMLVDQKLREGVAVPFFGRDAMTTPAPAVLALKTGARIVIASNRRLPGARFHVTVHGLLDFSPSGDDGLDTQVLTATVTQRIEQIIRDDPGQWLWIHNRWPTARDIELIKKTA